MRRWGSRVRQTEKEGRLSPDPGVTQRCTAADGSGGRREKKYARQIKGGWKCVCVLSVTHRGGTTTDHNGAFSACLKVVI